MSTCNTSVLPDSRLLHGDSSTESIMGDWALPDGTVVRIEVVPTYCGSCGRPSKQYVPKDNTAFYFCLCRPCFDKYGHIAGTMVSTVEEFNRDVEYEMMNKFGRALTDLELFHLLERGELGTALEKLNRESPYKVWATE